MTRLLLCGLSLAASVALADIPPPDLAGCSGKQAGAACERDDGSAGTCATSTCTRNDYSEGPPPKTVSYECFKCTAGAPPTPAPAQAPAPEKKSSCAAVPGLEVAALALALLLSRRRTR